MTARATVRKIATSLVPALLALSVSLRSQTVATPYVDPAGPERAHLSLDKVASDETIHIVVGRSLGLRSQSPIRRVYVGNPTVLQSFTADSQEILLTAKVPGTSSLVLWDAHHESSLYTVSCDIDPEELRHALHETYPSSSIDVQSVEGRMAISGTVTSPDISEGAGKIAGMYAKEVANSIRVVPLHGKQVELKLRIVEVDRNKLDQFGVNFNNGGRTTASTSTQEYTNPLTIALFNSKLNLGVQIQDLQQKQVLQVLAEPTLTTLSGLPARFLSGGEFPFPVVQGGTGNSTAVTIQFRSYGVKVDFTPTVNLDGSIRLKVAPEVSTLDYTNSVTISGFVIPALSTRRAETEVELKDGQTFMLSGLLDHRTTESLSKMPGVADIPFLGQMFRSKNNRRSVVELVVVVTVKVVDPLNEPNIVEEPKKAVPDMDAPTFDQQLKPKP